MILLSGSNYFKIEDMHSMTAFADYIVPVALNVMKITTYTPELDKKIRDGEMIERDSEEEIEIRSADPSKIATFEPLLILWPPISVSSNAYL